MTGLSGVSLCVGTGCMGSCLTVEGVGLLVFFSVRGCNSSACSRLGVVPIGGRVVGRSGCVCGCAGVFRCFGRRGGSYN